jgi:hypothetical protein
VCVTFAWEEALDDTPATRLSLYTLPDCYHCLLTTVPVKAPLHHSHHFTCTRGKSTENTHPHALHPLPSPVHALVVHQQHPESSFSSSPFHRRHPSRRPLGRACACTQHTARTTHRHHRHHQHLPPHLLHTIQAPRPEPRLGNCHHPHPVYRGHFPSPPFPRSIRPVGLFPVTSVPPCPFDPLLCSERRP